MCVCVYMCVCEPKRFKLSHWKSIYSYSYIIHLYSYLHLYIFKVSNIIDDKDHLTSNLITNLQIYSFTYIYLLTFLIQISFYKQFSNSYGIYINHRTIRGIIQIQTKIHIYIYIYIRYMK